MTKIYIKLIAMSLALILSVSVVLMSSYAWLVLSGNPAATGIQVAIGGGNTILTAPNIKQVVGGITYNIPGRFSDKLNFSQQEEYAYLQELGKLTPVSTTNGIDWFLPTYYSGNDDLVQQGKVASGALKDISEFRTDRFLSNANLKKNDSEIEKGNYIYLDFWVVSPGGDYTLRVSTGDGVEAGGSFVIDLPEAKEIESGYTLEAPKGSAAATVRVGFLANDLRLTDGSMELYTESRHFDNRFMALKGMYHEPNSGVTYLDANRFVIYEPNGDYHPEYPDLDGSYVETKSLEMVDGNIQENSRNRADLDLTVQRKNFWALENATSNVTALEQRFQAANISLLGKNLTAEERTDYFYGKYLQGQLSQYVDKGSFVTRTQNLITYTRSGAVPAEKLDLENGGATEDVYIIELERNIPQRIRMFIWLEGQDIDCVDKVSSARFAINIELAGGDK